jgi:5-methylcytosine-specific restriction protein A
MPVYPCNVPTCTAYVATRGASCADHAGRAAGMQRFYDRHQRNRDSKQFYDSAAWQRARKIRLAAHPICERCAREWAEHVHHTRPVIGSTWGQRLDQRYLQAVCPPCHNIIESEAAAAAARPC